MWGARKSDLDIEIKGGGGGGGGGESYARITDIEK